MSPRHRATKQLRRGAGPGVALMPLVLLSSVLVACAPWQTQDPVTPSSYQHSRAQVERSVGKLRRLAVLQIEQRAPVECHAGSAGEASFTAVSAEVLDKQLSHEKGYEVIVPNQPSAAFLTEAVQWPRTEEALAAGPATQSLLADLRTTERADGLLVLHTAASCSNANIVFRRFLSVSTLGMHALWPSPDSLKPFSVCSAWIFETAKARLVWHHQSYNCESTDPVSKLRRPDFGALLAPLESAVPRILTR